VATNEVITFWPKSISVQLLVVIMKPQLALALLLFVSAFVPII
jgi:hypothetical protein